MREQKALLRSQVLEARGRLSAEERRAAGRGIRDSVLSLPELQMEVKNNPGYAQAYLYLGDIALRTNDNEQAEPLITKAMQLQKDLRLAYFDLGRIYADQNKNQEAIAAFQRAVKLDPEQPDAHYRLARLYSLVGQKQKAAVEFAKTKELHSKTEDSLIQKVSGGAAAAPQ